jgi:glutamate synthase (NADPH/NADH) large chain
MPFEEITTSIDTPTTFPERIHSACGVGMRVNLPLRNKDGELLLDNDGQLIVEESHQVLLDGLITLGNFEYRSGEDDGAGIKVNGFSTAFFNKKIRAGEFITPTGDILSHLYLKKGCFVVGQYFLPIGEEETLKAKVLVEQSANKNGLTVVGWRYLNLAVDSTMLSDKARTKEPAQWQAIFLAKALEADEIAVDLEFSALKTGINSSYEAKKQRVALHLISLSSKYIVYKGMIHAKKVGLYFADLQDEDFTATGTEVHARFSTNTESEPHNAQPCENIEHNGELNSAPTNASEMRDELNAKHFEGVYPNPSLSDSMQFKADIHNQMAMKGVSFIDALVRLMPPRLANEDFVDGGYTNKEEIDAMLQCFRLERTGYNGPAFMTAGLMGYFVAKVDESGLRPSRWGIVEDANGHQQLHAASDDFLEAPAGGKIIKKSHLEPGGMVVVTPEGDILETKAILEFVCSRYNQTNASYFQQLLAAKTIPLIDEHLEPAKFQEHSTSDLNRILYSVGGDKETQEDIRYMAEKAVERVIAMGDDTDPLHSTIDFIDIAATMHELFAQVSAPSGDPINEPEDFWLSTSLGPVLESNAEGHEQEQTAKILLLKSPILGINDLSFIENHPDPEICTYILNLSFQIPISAEAAIDTTPTKLLRDAMTQLLKSAESAAQKPGGGILVLSDRHAGPDCISIPDVLAVAAVRKHLENKKLIRKVSIVADSYQIAGPHHSTTLLAFGAKSVYPRGAYAKITKLFEDNPTSHHMSCHDALKNYGKALQKSLLKTMGKMGLNDVNNYINGRFVAAIGLDLFEDQYDLADFPTLANIFKGLYSPLRGINLTHVANSLFRRHQQAYNPDIDFALLPHSGYYMPEENGIKHGYGPVVINAFTEWLKTEEMSATLSRMHSIFETRFAINDYIIDADSLYTPEKGFLDPRKKDVKGYYPSDYLERFRTSAAFKKMEATIDDYRKNNPTSIHDYFSIIDQDPATIRKILGLTDVEPRELQSQKDIRALLYAGSMSQGALTVTDPDSPRKKLGAHETLTRAMNATGTKSASGEGGEAHDDLRNPFTSTSSKQIASGRFGVSAMQILCAEEVEIKVAQGAKPGEGGQLPGLKVSVRFAAQRGGLPGTDFISPPPHHDTYSIEDLKQLIRDIKRVNPNASVSVKLVASQGIGTIAVGVAKAGADVINIAGNSGGTGAASQSSIKHAGMSAELGLAEVDKALRRSKKRDLVKLRVSGGFKTAEDVIIAAILGADLFEFGTTAMLTLGCKMQRTCNHSCQPGVTTDGHLFKGDQLNTERYFVNMAASIQERLQAFGISHLQKLRGRTELLIVLDSKIADLYNFSVLLDRSNLPRQLSEEELAIAQEQRQLELDNATEDALVADIKLFFSDNPKGTFSTNLLDPNRLTKGHRIKLTTQDLSFGARIAGSFVRHLEANPEAKIIINTTGNAGQSMGFVLPKGISLNHLGSVQDGCAKSMSSGELIINTPDQSADYRAEDHTIAGNALGYGASGGEVYVCGVAGNRAFVLAKGVTAVLEGVGRRAFEFMTSGTGMILGKVGKGLCASASGGIVFVYDKNKKVNPSKSVRTADSEESKAYEYVIRQMLSNHLEKTGSLKAKEIADSFDLSHFKVLIPKSMDKINTLGGVIDVIKTYQMRESPITVGMRVWLEQKTLGIVRDESYSSEKTVELCKLLGKNGVFTRDVCEELLRLIARKPTKTAMTDSKAITTIIDIEDLVPLPSLKIVRPVKERLKGGVDELFLNAIEHIGVYISELTHNAKGCSTCGAQSCAGGDGVGTGCPSGKNINTINSTLQRLGPIIDGHLTKLQWITLREAFEIQIKKSPFTRYTGAACPEPCKDACTETIPDQGSPDPKRDGKLIGEHVHIKEIELYLDQIGRALGWFNGKKEWSKDEVTHFFGNEVAKRRIYDAAMKNFKAPFCKPNPEAMMPDKELVIVGSGPAAMQIAFEALRDGVKVRMYEKSDKAGGLLADGIPVHKFDKKYLADDFDNLKLMGLELHLNSEVIYDASKGGFSIKGDSEAKLIVNSKNDNQHVVLCVGAGKPKALPFSLPEPHQNHIIQAIDILKAGNDVDAELKNYADSHHHQQQDQLDAKLKELIEQYFLHMNPLGKSVVVLGGGDTAKDVYSLLARYFSLELEEADRGHLRILIRGPKPVEKRGIQDSYPAPSKTPTKDNMLQAEELGELKKLGKFGDGDVLHLVVPTQIEVESGRLTVHISESKFKYQNTIEATDELKELFDALPREVRPCDKFNAISSVIKGIDLVICALGFQGQDSIPIIQAIKKADLKNVSIAGDAANVEPQIIVGAQASGYDTYYNKVRGAMGIFDERPAVRTSSQTLSGLVLNSIFSPPRKQDLPHNDLRDEFTCDF